MVREYVIVRPRAWSMRTEFREGEKVVAVLSGSKSFGRKAVATMDDKVFVLSTGGKRALRSRMRAAGQTDDIALMEHTHAMTGAISIGDEAYELTRTIDGPWEVRSTRRGLVMTFVRDPKDPSQGRAVMDLQDENALTLAVLAWFALRTMEC
ncbi:MAG TPA: hypothetical protein PLD09_03850 [Methanomassiliicoccaceae archaeon]|jgi:hypothetical protein|nr:hypothetical protein [Methanomassiliicoccaceae archaeon]HQA20990.1 hypothetical protein [Methanomassiliicoccaceae archaeon]HQD87415.1 hypothetical protein [Methanomassiliicoccaceae archaeon]